MTKMFNAGLALATVLMVFAGTPASGAAQTAAKKVECKDETYATAGSGACSGHGGVKVSAVRKAGTDIKETAKKTGHDVKEGAKKAGRATAEAAETVGDKTKEAAKKTGRAADKGEDKVADKLSRKATARCKDGTMSYAKNHTGACSRHGGVAEWLDGSAKKS
jgi:gas vesicle protein